MHSFGLATATKSSSSMPNTPGQKANLERSMSTHSVSDVAGTPYYRSPEQELGAVVDHKADMYAVGGKFAASLSCASLKHSHC